MKLRTLSRMVAFLAGLFFALLGGTWIYIAASGAVKTGMTQSYVAAGGFLLASTALLAFSFSSRYAKSLFVLVMFACAGGMLWLAFQPDLPTDHPVAVQVAAMALAVTLVARVGFALRRKSSALPT